MQKVIAVTRNATIIKTKNEIASFKLPNVITKPKPFLIEQKLEKTSLDESPHPALGRW